MTPTHALEMLNRATAPQPNEAYRAGWRDYEAGYYWPLAPDNPKYGDYIRGQNDAWAKINGRNISR